MLAKPTIAARRLLTSFFSTALLASDCASALSQILIPSPNLDLSRLGRVALAGNFDSVSLYKYTDQNQNIATVDGRPSILTTYPDGSFRQLSTANAGVATMCPFIANGALAGVVIGGNFTSLGGVDAQGVALWNPNTTQITALPGLTGKVATLFCDAENSMVYVGGAFTGANSANAIAWTTGWTNLPFAGFNGPVKSITKNAAGNIVFGGEFDALGNTTASKQTDGQVINLSTAQITAVGTTTTNGFQDPKNVICKTGDTDGPGNTWLLADRTGGYWQASFGFGFRPTKLRLYNTRLQGRGTKTFYFEELNSGGILNLNYIDAAGRNQSCSNRCPLPQNNATYQDFHFVPSVGMNMFRIYVVEWYGEGGGFSGIQLFQDDIFSFAVNDFNEPVCSGVSTGASSTTNPSSNVWTRVPNRNLTNSDFLSASLSQLSDVGPSTNVVFKPNVRQSGNYTITVYTPGCTQDNSCGRRGVVTVTANVTANGPLVTATLYQTNNNDKFDQIYFGRIDASSSSFSPSVTIAPRANQFVPFTVVAQRIGFNLVSTAGGLNGIYEYDPRRAIAEPDLSTSSINKAGASLGSKATVNSLVLQNGVIYAGGSFSNGEVSNIVAISDTLTSLTDGGLNSAVNDLHLSNNLIYVGGNFTNTARAAVTGLNYVGCYDTQQKSWSPLGAGVDGPVHALVPLTLNVTSGRTLDCLTVNGNFTSVQAFGNNKAFDASGIAVWVPSQNNWLSNLPNATILVRGQLESFTTVPGFPNLYAGQLAVQNTALENAIELVGSGQPTIQSLGIKFNTSVEQSRTVAAVSRRYLNPSLNYTGVYAGLFYSQNNLNLTILGGSFTAQGSNGATVENLAFINNTNSLATTRGLDGLDVGSTFLALDTAGTTLFAGGIVNGKVGNSNVNGLVVYNLAEAKYADVQPPALTGNAVVVNAIAVQPGSAKVFVGGNFTGAGSLPCSTLCLYDSGVQQWNTIGSGLGGTVSSMTWASNNQLIIAGDLTVNGNRTSMATYDAKTQTFETFSGASTVPGPISVFSVASRKYDQYWVSGIASGNGSTYLSKYSDGSWIGVGGFGSGTLIHGLQVLTLTTSHDSSTLVPEDEVLMLTGNINLPNYGNVSACLFNGTAFQPFLLSSKANGSQGFISNLFVSNPQNFMSAKGGHLALGLVVLIGLAIALGLVFLLVVAGIFMERNRRRREGYVPMSMDRKGNLERIPPESLLGGIAGKGDSPRI